jgi:hypothetical protein
MSTTVPALSAVVPVYNEAGNVLPLLHEIDAVLHSLGEPYEIIFVNDGSRDDTLRQLRGAMAAVPALRILDLDGNCGEAGALCAGFQAARGTLVITLDGDGQNDPRDIPQLLQTLRSTGCRAVSGWRQERQEGQLLRVLPSRIANRMIALVTRIPVHDNGCGLKVYRREVVSGAALPRGMNRFMPAIFGVTASEVAEVAVHDRRRQHGQSHYGLGRTLVVLRDLLALRCIIANPRAGAALAAAATLAAAAVAAGAVRYGLSAVALLATAAAAATATVWWNLRRFNRAQRQGVFRIRREYSSGTGPTPANRARRTPHGAPEERPT